MSSHAIRRWMSILVIVGFTSAGETVGQEGGFFGSTPSNAGSEEPIDRDRLIEDTLPGSKADVPPEMPAQGQAAPTDRYGRPVPADPIADEEEEAE